MGLPCCIGTSGTNHLVLYCSIQDERQSSTALLQKFEKSHSCFHLLNNLCRLLLYTYLGSGYVSGMREKVDDKDCGNMYEDPQLGKKKKLK